MSFDFYLDLMFLHIIWCVFYRRYIFFFKVRSAENIKPQLETTNDPLSMQLMNTQYNICMVILFDTHGLFIWIFS